MFFCTLHDTLLLPQIILPPKMKRTCDTQPLFSSKRVHSPLPRQTFVTLLGAHLASSTVNTWMSDGASFKIVDKEEMAVDVSQRSRPAKPESVVRQLNLHGFRCVRSPDMDDAAVYSHPLFHRDRPEQWNQIQRHTANSPSPQTTMTLPPPMLPSLVFDDDMFSHSPLDSILDEDPYDIFFNDNIPSPVSFEATPPPPQTAPPAYLETFMTSVLDRLKAMEDRLVALEESRACITL